MITLFRFDTFLKQVAQEYGEESQFAFIAIETESMRFPTFEMPTVDVVCEGSDEGVALVIAENPAGKLLTVAFLIDAVAGKMEEEAREALRFVFKDADGNIVFETNSLEDYEYSVVQPDGYRSTHSF